MIRALRDGVRDGLAHWPSALLLYAAVLIPAVLVGYVFHTSVVSAFGRSAALETLSQGFFYTTIFDLVNREGFRMWPVIAMSLGFLIVSLPLHSFLTAGAVSALTAGGAWSSRTYFAGAARYTGGFLVLSLLALGAVLLIATLALAASGLLFVDTEDATHPGVLAILASGVVVVAFVLTLGDYARIHLIQDPERGVVGSVRAAAEFLVRHAGGVAALTFVLALVSLLPLIGLVAFEDAVPPAVGGWLVPLVLVQQAAVILRSGVRVAAFAAQSSFVRSAYGTLRHGEEPSAPSPFLAQGL
jgi:hypothetical protein